MMNRIPYTEIETATADDIGKTCLMQLGCNPLAIEPTLAECIDTARGVGMQIDEDEIDDHTDLVYLSSGDLVAVVICEPEDA